MAPILDKQTDSTRPTMQTSLSQAESVAQSVAGVATNTNDDATDISTPPSTPPRATSPPPKRQESALKRLAGRLRQRRSLSAPPALRRRRPDKLIEEHFRRFAWPHKDALQSTCLAFDGGVRVVHSAVEGQTS